MVGPCGYASHALSIVTETCIDSISIGTLTRRTAAAGLAAVLMISNAFASAPKAREASGTSWQPDSTPMGGRHLMWGDWMVMVHGYWNAICVDADGARGDTDAFSQSMLMAMGQRKAGPGTLSLRSMISLDPLLGQRESRSAAPLSPAGFDTRDFWRGHAGIRHSGSQIRGVRLSWTGAG